MRAVREPRRVFIQTRDLALFEREQSLLLDTDLRAQAQMPRTTVDAIEPIVVLVD
jgi:hypothetical protein